MPNETKAMTRQFHPIEMREVDEGNKQVEAIWTTGSRGLRSGWFGRYYEELGMKAGEVRLDRAKRGLPLLDGHRFSNETVIGRAKKVKIGRDQEGERVGTARLDFDVSDDNPLASQRFRQVREGILTDLSVGYNVYRYKQVGKETTEEGEEIPIFRAVDWEPIEISVVPGGFDIGAVVSQRECDNVNCTFEFAESEPEAVRETAESTHEKPGDCPEVVEGVDSVISVNEAPVQRAVNEEAANMPSENAPKIDPEQIKREAVEAERSRVNEIRSLCDKAGIDAGGFISEGSDLNVVRDAVIEALATRGATQRAPVTVSSDDTDVKIDGMRDAILHRANGRLFKLSENGRRFRSMSLLDMARSCENLPSSMSSTEVIARAFQTTSSFTNLLENTTTKSLRDQFEANASMYEPMIRRGTVPDFKASSRVKLSEMGTLKEIPEHGEMEQYNFSDSKEQIQLKTYGRKIGLTRQAIINDDLDAFARLPQIIARKSRSLEADLIADVLINNAALSDGVALFASDHGNLGSAGAISDTTLAELYKLFRNQTDEADEVINLMPRFLIVPSTAENAARKYLNSVVIPETAANANIYQGSMEIIVDPRLELRTSGSTTAWYVAADPMMADTIELANLQGQETIQIAREESNSPMGVSWYCWYDVGVKAIDYRGLFKNAGA